MINFQAMATILYVVDGRVVNDVFPSFAVAMRNLRHYGAGSIVVPMAITDETMIRHEEFIREDGTDANTDEGDVADWQIELMVDHDANMAALRDSLSA